METPVDTRRSSLETDVDSKLNESMISEYSHLSYNPMELSQISGWSAVNAKWDISLPLDLNFDGDNSNGASDDDNNVSQVTNKSK